MNLPNKLTLMRILLIPVMIIIYYIKPLREIMIVNSFSLCYLIMLLIFAIASLTDFLDGHLARKHNLVTTFGKFADPLADKILVVTALVLLCADHLTCTISKTTLSLVPAWTIAVILAREFIVSGIRMIAVEKNGTVIAAKMLGKIKTTITMIAIIVLFLSGMHPVVGLIGNILLYLAVIATIVSGFDYFWKSKDLIFESI